MSYGDPEKVAALAKVWTEDGSFLDSATDVYPTNPSLAEVVNWLDEISSLFNAALANEGFSVPVDPDEAPEAFKALTVRTCTLVADLCAFTNSKGRLFSDRVTEIGPMNVVNKEINGWVKDNAVGLENLGIPRTVQHGSYGAFSVPISRQT